MPYGTCLQGIYGAGGLPWGSLDFDGSGAYLSMSDADFGSYDITNFGFAMSFVPDVSSSMYLLSKWNSAAIAEREFELQFNPIGNTLLLRLRGSAGSSDYITSGSFSTGTWHHLLVLVDFASGVTIMRNGSSVLATSSSLSGVGSAVNTGPAEIRIGQRSDSSGPSNSLNGLINQFAFFSGTLPDPADVFDADGKLKNLRNLTGLYSFIPATDDVVSDAILATDWTNNGSVTISTDKP